MKTRTSASEQMGSSPQVGNTPQMGSSLQTGVSEQLTLIDLPPADGVPVSLRLSKHTRIVGLQGVAAAKALLAAQAAEHRREAAEGRALAPPRAA